MTDAVSRAMEMMRIPMKDLPVPALKYAAYMCEGFGMCMEVLITAYAVYAQVIDGLTTEDEAYMVCSATRADFDRSQTDFSCVIHDDGRISVKRIVEKRR